MNSYPSWKYVLLLIVFLVSGLYALPNVYGEDPAVQVSVSGTTALPEGLADRVRATLQAKSLAFKGVEVEHGLLLVRFGDTAEQLKARDELAAALGDDYVPALNLAPRTPAWLSFIGAKPMALGLDLRGGVHFLMEVDMPGALKQAGERYSVEIRELMQEKGIRYVALERRPEGVLVRFRDDGDLKKAKAAIADQYDQLKLESPPGEDFGILASLTEAEQKNIRQSALQQNITTLRNRVNELGVVEPLIQQQGDSRIVVELPGVQDTSRAKEILGATATLEFHLVAAEDGIGETDQSVRSSGSRLYKMRDGSPVMLKRETIVSGNQLISATSGFDQTQGTPMVSVTLDGKGAQRMGDVTRQNIGKPMAVVFIETKNETVMQEGKSVKVRRTREEVINVATIRDSFSKRFQISGLDPEEAKNLALLLRAGSLAAPMDIVEERTVGPSLGKENIERGMNAVVVGFVLVGIFMAIYYRVFGLVANLTLLFNVFILVAALSMLQATLTLPGMAGIVLTVGMAVDANVLINERIREELRRGNSPFASIEAGYNRAFATILDSNVSTLIAALALLGLGSGPVRGFAVVLSIGILASMFTAITSSRAVIQLIYGGKRLRKLSI